MKRILAAALLTATLLAAPEPIIWIVQGVPSAPVKAGTTFSIKLTAKIQDGWHLYSMKPMSEGPIPTRIWLAEGQAFSLAGPVVAPEPQVMHDRSFGMEVELYEQDAVFTLPVKAAAGTSGAKKLVVNASYQTCDNRVCLPPRTVRVELPVTIAK